MVQDLLIQSYKQFSLETGKIYAFAPSFLSSPHL